MEIPSCLRSRSNVRFLVGLVLHSTYLCKNYAMILELKSVRSERTIAPWWKEGDPSAAVVNGKIRPITQLLNLVSLAVR